MRPLSPVSEPISPAKFAHFVLRTGQFEKIRSTTSRHLRKLDGYFHSRAFAENPVGVTYDPEELCQRYEAGEPLADLLGIPPLPEGKTPWDMLARH